MIDFTPINEIKRRYRHLQDFESFQRTYEDGLTPVGLDILNQTYDTSADNRAKMTGFYDYLCAHDVNEIQRYGKTAFTEALIPEVLNSISGARHVLDIGCFDGLHTVLYALNMPDTSFVGMDLSQEGLRAALRNKERYSASNTRFVAADVFDLPFNPQFDAVIATNVLNENYLLLFTGSGYQTDLMLSEKLSRIKSVTRPGSNVVLSFFPTFIDHFEDYLNSCLGFSSLEIVEVKRLQYDFFGETRTAIYAVAKTPKKP